MIKDLRYNLSSYLNQFDCAIPNALNVSTWYNVDPNQQAIIHDS